MGSEEALMMSVLGGMFFCFWGLLFVALVRLIWANLYGSVPWVRTTNHADDAAIDPNDPASPRPRRKPRLPPESLAMLIALGVMFLGVNPLLAAIIAIVVWRVATHYAPDPQPQRATLVGGTGTRVDSGSVPDGEVREESFMERVNSVLQIPLMLLQRLGEAAGQLFDLDLAERRRILVATTWYITGGFELLFSALLAIVFFAERGNWLIEFVGGVLSFAMSLLSFGVAQSIYVRQNYNHVRGASVIGLLPVSVGAIARVPLSVVTLLWLHSSGVKESFAPTPWRETDLGRFLNGNWTRTIRRCVGTIAWLCTWSLFCTVLLVATIACYVVPFGPSVYHVIDQSAHAVRAIEKGKPTPNLLIGVDTSGYGSASGLYPATHVYRSNAVRLAVSNGSTTRVVNIQLGPTLWMESPNSRVEFTANSCRTFLIEATGQEWPDHAEKLFMAINQLYSRPTPEFRRALYAPSLDAAAEMSVAERFRDNAARFMGSNGIRPLPGFVTFASRLDPNLFRVESTEANQIGTGGCTVIATWFVIALGVGSVLVWSLGAWRIVSKRHRQPQAIPTKAAASST